MTENPQDLLPGVARDLYAMLYEVQSQVEDLAHQVRAVLSRADKLVELHGCLVAAKAEVPKDEPGAGGWNRLSQDL